jgi:hypothetical protein
MVGLRIATSNKRGKKCDMESFSRDLRKQGSLLCKVGAATDLKAAFSKC